MKTSALFLALGISMSLSFASKPVEIVISEVFPDPTPSIGLPEKEFIELFNAGNDPIHMKGWTIADRDKTYSFPDYNFLPGTYLLLCKTSDLAEFKSFGPTLGFSSFVSLNNDGDDLYLKKPDGSLCFHVSYSAGQIIGGKTLENGHLISYCSEGQPFDLSASSKGGTPGTCDQEWLKTINNSPPKLISCTAINDSIFVMELTSGLSSRDSNLSCMTLDGVPCRAASLAEDSGSKVKMSFWHTLLHGRSYQVSVGNIFGCYADSSNTLLIPLFLADQADSGDIVINEILFNPSPGNDDFVELYNRSEKFIQLTGNGFSNQKDFAARKIKRITGTPIIFPPNSYMAFTPEKEKLLQKYPGTPAELIIEMDLPSWNDDTGTVIFSGLENRMLDKMHYEENYHSPLLADKEGVSLERVSSLLASDLPDNWHSGAEQVGYATPGKKNSQSREVEAHAGWKVFPKCFSPDGDGFEDFVEVLYTLSAPSIGSVNVYDIQGHLIRTLISNASLPISGAFQWDGSCNDASLAHPGYYIFAIDLFDLEGNTARIKRSVAINF